MPTNQANQTQTATPLYETGPYVYRLTNAPDEYDYAGTERYYGTDYEDGLMLVAIPNHIIVYNNQVGRYASGMYRCESPRIQVPKYYRRYTTVNRSGREVLTDVTEVDTEAIIAQASMDLDNREYNAVRIEWVWEDQD
ncbi:hypothetical protein [Microcystis phage Mvi-JY20]|uniref:Uncharacterized protein n=1 Tax=Microcystis phage Mvi-JY20 TaxID=3128146 RepID=A0AAX4QGY6_9CAUD